MFPRLGFVLLLVLAACAAPPSTVRAPEPEEYAVWSAALEHLHGAESRSLAVDSLTTSLFPRHDEPKDRLARDGVALAMVDRFIARNRRKALIDHTRLRAGGTRLVAEREVDAGTARIFLSRVAFDDARARAVVEVYMNCGDLCGEGGMVELVRDGAGRWTFVRRVYHYVS